MLDDKRQEFSGLFAEFVQAYAQADVGRKHAAAYIEGRTQAQKNLESILAMRERGEDITDGVLLKLLPYADSPANRAQGLWIHIAPGSAVDVRKRLEGKHLTRPEDWPDVAQAILQFVLRCREAPAELGAACADFAELPYSKGFQSGMLTPILNALRPDEFAVINHKSRLTLNHFAGTKYGQTLSEYPKLNAIAHEFVAEVTPEVRQSGVSGIRPDDLLDMFCHWLVAVREYGFDNSRYWKIAPGDNAWNWEACRDGGFIAVGWDDLGDLSLLSKEEYEVRRDQLVAQASDWTKTGTDQAWTFAHDIREGDRVVANRGIREVVGIGTVTGAYYFVPGVRHGHRLPVEWDDTTRRSVAEGGWRRTLIELKKGKFESIRSAAPITEHKLAEPFSRVFGDWQEAEWAFGLLQETTKLLGVSGPDDERFALTLRPVSQKGRRLRLNYGPWLILEFRGPASAWRGVLMALLIDKAGDLQSHYVQTFSQAKGKPQVGLYVVPEEMVRSPESNVLKLYWETLGVVQQLLGHWKRTNYRHAHQSDIAMALFQPEALEHLLSTGVPGTDPEPGCFSDGTFDLLAKLSENPTSEIYTQNKEVFRTQLEEPFKTLFATVIQKLPPAIKDVMETEKHLYSRILKNDFGRGGAWSHYWGAIYPKGSRRMEDAQLSVWMDKDVLAFGFYIGAYGVEPRSRFWRNIQANRAILASILADSLHPARLRYGEESDSPASFDAWMRKPQPFPDVDVVLSRDEVLANDPDELAEQIASTFELLFPLVLLAISDDPLPLIQRSLGYEQEPEQRPSYTLQECATDTGVDLLTLERWTRAIERKKQAILYGPPGTGKTFMARHLARHLVGDTDGFYEIVQFHPAYAYEDFVQGIRPQKGEQGQLEYPVMPGRFLNFCIEAGRREGPCVLIVDEINRANLARVFGELMYLLEYRAEKVRLAVDGREFSIPENVRILGTMNTADRSIALVDHALRRRFAFIGLAPNYTVLRTWHQNRHTGLNVAALESILSQLNGAINDPNYAVGISFFLVEEPAKQLEDIWRMEIEPYLEEYFFDQREAVEQFRWDRICGKVLGQ